MKHWHTSSALTGGGKDFFGHASGGGKDFFGDASGGGKHFFHWHLNGSLAKKIALRAHILSLFICLLVAWYISKFVFQGAILVCVSTKKWKITMSAW